MLNAFVHFALGQRVHSLVRSSRQCIRTQQRQVEQCRISYLIGYQSAYVSIMTAIVVYLHGT